MKSSDDPLRIGLYAPVLPGSGVSNGIVTYTGIMRDALRALGHSVVVATTDAVEYPDGSVAVLGKPSALTRRLSAFRENRIVDGSNPWVRFRVLNAFKAARAAGVQVYEMEESHGWAGRLTGKGVAIVERLHGPHVLLRDAIETAEQKRLGDQRQRAEHAAFGNVQAVTAPTSRLLEEMRGYGVTSAISRAIPNPMPVAPPDCRWNLGRAHPNQVLFVGRFDLCKGADVIIRAFTRSLERNPSLMLVMAGPDPGLAQPNGDFTHFDEFLASEVAPAVRSRIRFMGELSAQKITELRLQSALTVTASRFENFPYGIAEAMAVGMPVLTTATFGGSEMIRDGIDGRVVEIGEIDAMADAIGEMIGNPKRLKEMGQSAYNRVAHWLSPESVARQTVEVYREAIARL
jgi:glycosyltransferase involved in cell wall biosynthesis